MEENPAVHKAAVDRSPRFPFIPLAKALERAGQFYEKERKGIAPFSAAAQHWGYSPSSSGAMQTLGALKSYGLLDGTRNGIRLTELALNILLDKRPDQKERALRMRQAAVNPGIAADLYAKWPDDLPSDATLHHFLVLERGFNESTALKAIEIIKQNQLLTMSARPYDISDVSEIKEEPDMEASREEKAAPADLSRSGPLPKNVIRQLSVERVRTPTGESIELRFVGTPTKAVYDFLKAYADFMAQQCKATSGTQSDDGTQGGVEVKK